jgi:hypothetical protein
MFVIPTSVPIKVLMKFSCQQFASESFYPEKLTGNIPRLTGGGKHVHIQTQILCIKKKHIKKWILKKKKNLGKRQKDIL